MVQWKENGIFPILGLIFFLKNCMGYILNPFLMKKKYANFHQRIVKTVSCSEFEIGLSIGTFYEKAVIYVPVLISN